MANNRKPGGRRQRRAGADLELVEDPTADVPPPPHPQGRKLLKATVERWEQFWSSEVAPAVTVADHAALARLFRMYDQRERFERIAMKDPFVTGSTGQPVAHPALKQIGGLDKSIVQLEDRFGITPKARLQLGLAGAGLRKSVEDLNRDFVVDDDDGDIVDAELVEPDEDPRRKSS